MIINNYIDNKNKYKIKNDLYYLIGGDLIEFCIIICIIH
jgi:hypothetical protein